MRDTVYNGLLKRTRATLHINFVKWADRINAERGRAMEFQEILGYHLEQAHRYLAELGPLDEQGVAIGVDAAGRLADAARRGFARGDMHAAANLFGARTALLGEAEPKRARAAPELGEVLLELGDFTRAQQRAGAGAGVGRQRGERRIERRPNCSSCACKSYSGDPATIGGRTLRVANEAIPLFESHVAHPELARAWRLIGLVHGMAASYGQSTEAVSRSMQHARLAGDERLIARNAMGISISTLLGSTPVPQAIVDCEAMLAAGLNDRQAQSKILCTLAQLRAMNGEFDAARALYRRGRSLLRDLGQGVNAASTGIDLLSVELLAGDLATRRARSHARL